MRKILINGVPVEVSEQAEAAITAERATTATAHATALRDAVDNVGKEKTRADAAEKKAGEESARADVATTAEKAAKKQAEEMAAGIKAGVRARKSLEQDAERVMGADAFEAAKLGDADDDDVRAAVVKHCNPSASIDEKVALAKKGDNSAKGYLAAMWDNAIAGARTDGDDDGDDGVIVPEPTKADSAGNLRRASKGTRVDAEGASEAARQKAIADRNNRWQAKA